jgi:hypothetical protein
MTNWKRGIKGGRPYAVTSHLRAMKAAFQEGGVDVSRDPYDTSPASRRMELHERDAKAHQAMRESGHLSLLQRFMDRVTRRKKREAERETPETTRRSDGG